MCVVSCQPDRQPPWKGKQGNYLIELKGITDDRLLSDIRAFTQKKVQTAFL